MLVPKTTSMQPKRREMWRGDTFSFDLDPIIDPKTNIPRNLTGCKLWFTAKGNVALNDNQASIALDTASLGGVTIVDPVRALVTVTVPPIATRALPDGPVVLVYDVQLMLTNGTILTVEAGSIIVFPDVTRAIA